MSAGEREVTLAPPLRPREPLIDALRMLAIAGVFTVNAMSYATGPYGSLLGQPQPAESAGALAVFLGVAVLFQAKAYPLLAFLFGYSFALSMRARAADAMPHRRRRMWRLLLLGVLHGALLYSGDILTPYAICGLVLLRWGHAPLRALLRRLRWLLPVWGASMLLGVALSLSVFAASEPPLSYAVVSGWRAWLSLNFDAYKSSVLATPLLFLPELLALTLAGLIAGRLRWLTHARWQSQRLWLARGLPWALVANAAYAGALAWALPHGLATQNAVVFVSVLVGPWLSATAVAAMAACWYAGRLRLLGWLAPAGRYTLSMYVGASVVMCLVYSGAGLAWQPGTVIVVALALASWVAAAELGRRAARAGLVGPLERWLARKPGGLQLQKIDP